MVSVLVTRIDRLLAIERERPERRGAVGEAHGKLSADPCRAPDRPRAQRERTSRKSEIGKAIDCTLTRWEPQTRFLDNGRICLSNNAAERALRGIAVGRHSWTFAGSDRDGERAAAMYALIETATLNGVNPEAWLADILARLPDHPARRLDDPWNWTTTEPTLAV